MKIFGNGMHVREKRKHQRFTSKEVTRLMNQGAWPTVERRTLERTTLERS